MERHCGSMTHEYEHGDSPGVYDSMWVNGELSQTGFEIWILRLISCFQILEVLQNPWKQTEAQTINGCDGTVVKL